jgi:hypothetical protein
MNCPPSPTLEREEEQLCYPEGSQIQAPPSLAPDGVGGLGLPSRSLLA